VRCGSHSRRLVTAAIFLLAAGGAGACTIPVYQWAREQWAADSYLLLVFHDAPLSPAQRTLLDRFESAEAPNLLVQTVNLGGALDETTQNVWNNQENAETPWLVLRYPHAPPARPDVWAGPLSEANIDALCDSPARRSLAERLMKGDAGVWVLLESGDAAKDRAALETLEQSLQKTPETLRQPPVADLQQRDLTNPASLGNVVFSTLRVSRSDPVERIFVEMLLGTESDLRDYTAPMVFPVFGRGRALYALVGDGINADTIGEACVFLATACTCMVKEQNPGADLLLAADWGSISELTAYRDTASSRIVSDIPLSGGNRPLVVALGALAGAFIAAAGCTAAIAWRRRAVS